MHLHILGICGTFMGGIAQLAQAMGHRVTGSDTNVYPPMSSQLEAAGITLYQGYDTDQFDPRPDVVVIGNAMSRGNPAVEYVLAQGLAYTSGPQWLAEHVLQDRWVLGVAGTHGKTTTSSLLAWILEDNQMQPGFLIGGVPANFGISARLGQSPFFVVEADEYDTAFFDKRSKFVHYRSRTLVMNNIEFDHADIFANLEAIQIQFHHLVRTVPANGLIIRPAHDTAVDQVIARGCWTPQQTIGEAGDWEARLLRPDGSEFELLHRGQCLGPLRWDLLGVHNVNNALAAIAAAHHAGVPVANACDSLATFKGIKRRMEERAVVNGVTVYDDFAHHPTAIRYTLEGLRNKVGKARIIAILEPRSNTMRMGVHADSLAAALVAADEIYLYQSPELGWSPAGLQTALGDRLRLATSTEDIVRQVGEDAISGDQILIMSNGGFEGLHQRLIDRLRQKFAN